MPAHCKIDLLHYVSEYCVLLALLTDKPTLIFCGCVLLCTVDSKDLKGYNAEIVSQLEAVIALFALVQNGTLAVSVEGYGLALVVFR